MFVNKIIWICCVAVNIEPIVKLFLMRLANAKCISMQNLKKVKIGSWKRVKIIRKMKNDSLHSHKEVKEANWDIYQSFSIPFSL